MSRDLPYRGVVRAAAVLALALLVVWVSQPSRARAPTTTSTPAATRSQEGPDSTTAGPEPTSLVTPAAAVAPQATAATSTPPITPTVPAITPTAAGPGPSPLGRSQVAGDASYYADVLAFQFVGSSFRMQIDAAGRPDMVAPWDSCLSDTIGGRIRASTFVPSVSLPGEHAGYLEFPAEQVLPGVAYSFSYSCAYSAVPLGVLLAR